MHQTTGAPPPGLYLGACTSLSNSLYWFGGYDGVSDYYCSLHRLDSTTLEWRELQPLNQADGPMRKAGCGMITVLQNQLAMAFAHVPLNLEQCLLRIPMEKGRAVSSISLTSQGVCEHCLIRYCVPF